jgi:hypothetical protein
MPGSIKMNIDERCYGHEPAMSQLRELRSKLAAAQAALQPLALIPLEEFTRKRLDQPLMGWNAHTVYVRDIYKAREALR